MDTAAPQPLAYPPRPTAVSVGAGLLAGCAAILLLAWVAAPESVTSNGGQVFFMILWLWLAYSSFAGLGWVRIAIALVLGTFIWGLVNSESFEGALRGTSVGDLASKLMALAAFVTLCVPSANRWFGAVAESQAED